MYYFGLHNAAHAAWTAGKATLLYVCFRMWRHCPAGINRDTPEIDIDWLAAYVVSNLYVSFNINGVITDEQLTHDMGIGCFMNHTLRMLTVSSDSQIYSRFSITPLNTNKKSSPKTYAGNSLKYLTLLTDCSSAVLKVLLT